LKLSLRICGAGSAATILGDAQWAFLEAEAHNTGLAWGCGVAAIGAAFMALLFLFARPEVD
jgi:hypothetical protein